ncbi:MAG: aminotransferase class III-fold pyridoxal phosphate-dependent enzyme [Alphaproteobacteria bacterium]|nr:aminotransferase class III-fold pyridoxal phosphate-dependent enzyme [Alphaproteobacteria bacterium]
MTYDFTKTPASLDEFWMPFTPERMFKKNPRIAVRADGMHFTDDKGNKILDMSAGQWCTNAGHNRPKIREAIMSQLDSLDFMTCMNMSHPSAFMAAERLVKVFPKNMKHVFFSNSGSEAVDTALKIALAYQRKRGKPTKRILIGREQAYHGVNFGGISVGGLSYNKSDYGGQLLPALDHLPTTFDLENAAFSKGEPDTNRGIEKANALEGLIALHDASNIAAVIVEPVVGSWGVIPPPKGYLKRLREICDKHDILLIFDEVITGFGRLGDYSASTYFDVLPDIITTAKGLTNSVVPMGATFVTGEIYNAFMQGSELSAELMHGYTYSGHPLAAAAAIGNLDTFEEDKICANAAKMAPFFEEALHSLKGLPHIIDVRNLGILGAVQFESHSADNPYHYSRQAFLKLYEKGIYIRFTAYSLTLSPPLILDQSHIDQSVSAIRDVVKSL